jgi:hypothetical protein
MLEQGSSEAELTGYLHTTLRDHFGLQPVPDRERAFAASVKEWFETRRAQETD